MKADRYAEWAAVWNWFLQTDTTKVIPRNNWDGLYALLDGLYRDERQDATLEELAAHAGMLNKLRGN